MEFGPINLKIDKISAIDHIFFTTSPKFFKIKHILVDTSRFASADHHGAAEANTVTSR